MLTEPIITEKETGIAQYLHVRPLLIVALAVLLGVLVFVLTFMNLWQPKLATDDVSLPTDGVKNAEELTGKIYMSLAPLDAEGGAGPLGIYTYDVSTGEALPLLAEDVMQFMTSEVSPDGTKVALISFTDDHDEPLGLYVSDTAFSEMTEIAVGEPFAKRNPAWSPDGKLIAFMGRGKDHGDDLDVESWNTYLYDTESMQVRDLGPGSGPQFTPEGNLVVLKRNGLNLIDVRSGESTVLIAAANDSARANMKFDVSQDGTKIAWALPDNGRVNIIEVDSWMPFVATTTDSIGASAFWPVFSPGGEYLAMEAFDWEVTETNEKYPMNQRLVIFSLKDKKWTEVVHDLGQFYQESMYITDWK